MTEHKREQGMALLMTVLLLLMLASLGFASLNVVEKDQQVAGHLNRRTIALHAADAAVSKALETLEVTGTPSVPATTLGDAGTYPQGRPSYRLDTTAADPVAKTGVGNPEGTGLGIGAGAAPQFQIQYWTVRVQGEAPGGTVARVEILTGAILAN